MFFVEKNCCTIYCTLNTAVYGLLVGILYCWGINGYCGEIVEENFEGSVLLGGFLKIVSTRKVRLNLWQHQMENLISKDDHDSIPDPLEDKFSIQRRFANNWTGIG